MYIIYVRIIVYIRIYKVQGKGRGSRFAVILYGNCLQYGGPGGLKGHTWLRRGVVGCLFGIV